MVEVVANLHNTQFWYLLSSVKKFCAWGSVRLILGAVSFFCIPVTYIRHICNIGLQNLDFISWREPNNPQMCLTIKWWGLWVSSVPLGIMHLPVSLGWWKLLTWLMIDLPSCLYMICKARNNWNQCYSILTCTLQLHHTHPLFQRKTNFKYRLT